MSRYYVRGHQKSGYGNVFLTAARKAQAVEVMSQSGNLNEVCRRLGCTDQTVHRAIRSDPAFGSALREAREQFWANTPHDRNRYRRGCRCETCVADYRRGQRERKQLRKAS